MRGSELREIREKQDITVQELASYIGVSRGVIYYTESMDKVDMKVKTFKDWMVALGLDPSKEIKKL